ncbi:MAG: DUF5804 family protein [Halobacteriales archaeon]
MTQVCLLGQDGIDLRAELMAYETARNALAQYAIDEPYANAVAVETISLGAAVSLLNDLNWYLVRLVDEALVLEPSIAADEWLSRNLATAIRNETIDPSETGTMLKVYGVKTAEADGARPVLTEPMYLRRTDGSIPSYDLADVDETLIVRITAEEFEG